MRYGVVFKEEVDVSLLKKHGATNIDEFKVLKKIAFCDFEDDYDITLLEQEDVIQSVEDESEIILDDVSPSGNYTMPSQEIPYFFDKMGIDTFHSNGYTGKGVKVAVIDGGCQPHQDLTVAGGFNAYNNRASGYMNDIKGHGTHVAGTIAMKDNNLGYVGVAPDCDLYVINRWSDDRSSGGSEAYIRGIDWCVRNNIDIVNCSFSSMTTFSWITYEAYKQASESGLIIVQSAGNSQNDSRYNGTELSGMSHQASFPFVVTVANLGENGQRYSSSAVGDQLDFAAYGHNIPSTHLDDNYRTSRNYRTMTGTSMASPVISGMLALYKSMYPELNNKDLINRVKRNTKKVGTNWETGAGLPQYPKENVLDVQSNHFNGDVWDKLMPKTHALNIETVFGDNLEDVLATLFNMKLSINSSGDSYVLFDNGLGICWGEPSERLQPNEAQGNIYRSSTSGRWRYPIAFKSQPFTSVSCNNSQCWATSPNAGGLTSMNYRVMSATRFTSTYVGFNCFAIGFWK